MTTTPSIVVGTDFSRGSQRAVSRARLLAERLHWRLVATHVVRGPHGSAAERDAATAEALRTLQATVESNGTPPTHVVSVGAPHEELVRAAESESAHVIVVGAHHAGHELVELLLGSTAERVVRSGHCAVLVARLAPTRVHRVALVPVDLGDSTSRLLKTADELFPDAKLVVVHCIDAEDAHRAHAESKEAADAATAATRGRLEQIVAALRLDPVRCTIQVATAREPRRRILELAKHHDADVIALGTHARTGIKRMLLGSTADHVVRHAPCDVMVLPP